MESCVLFESPCRSVVLVDLARSIEECQFRPGQSPDRGLILQAAPPNTPFPTRESGNSGGQRNASLPPSTLLAELMAAESVRSALVQVNTTYSGPWILPRDRSCVKEPSDIDNDESAMQQGGKSLSAEDCCYIPPDSQYLEGSIQDMRDQFLRTAPLFNLIIMDPPWPNRSAKRKRNNYSTMLGLNQARALLEQIPVAAKLATTGMVAVWVTNSPGVYTMLTGPRGILSVWGLDLVTEWTWLKVTASGDPIFDIECERRKPWERLVIAKRKGVILDYKISEKVIISVPDTHSRKPNVRSLFDPILGQGYKALEVFARNLTSEWWSWGDEVLKFQNRKYWESDIASSS